MTDTTRTSERSTGTNRLEQLDLRRLTGILLVVTAIGFNGFYTLLATTFEYPDILRRPTGYVLTEFHAGGDELIVMWYGMVLVSILLAPVVVLFYQLLAEEGNWYLLVGTVFGLFASLANVLGFVRWVFLVPQLAATYVDPGTSEAARAATVVTFEAFHLYAGFSVGEHLGYLFLGMWLAIVGATIYSAERFAFGRGLGVLAILAAALIGFGATEGAGIESAATVNVVGFALMSLWMVLLAIVLVRADPIVLEGSIKSERGNI